MTTNLTDERRKAIEAYAGEPDLVAEDATRNGSVVLQTI